MHESFVVVFFFMNRERSRANLQYKIYTCVTERNARWQQPQQQQRTASEIIPGSDFVAIVRLRVRGLELIIRACMSLENSTNLQEDLSTYVGIYKINTYIYL